MVNPLLRYAFFAILSLLLAGGAIAQQRLLPSQGKRGELGAPLPLPMLQVGRQMLRLAPGGVIYDASNRTILHSALPPQAAVLYTTDGNGEVQRLYVLTPAEQATLDAKGAR